MQTPRFGTEYIEAISFRSIPFASIAATRSGVLIGAPDELSDGEVFNLCLLLNLYDGYLTFITRSLRGLSPRYDRHLGGF